MSYNNILWSKGPFRNSYSKLDTGAVVNDYVRLLVQQSNGCLWIRNTCKSKPFKTDLDYVAKYLSLLKKPTVLITSDGDRPVPSSYDTKLVHLILNHPNITAWYTQNYDKSIIHSKLKYMPIGFDLHTKSMLINNSRDQKLQYMCHCR